MAMNAVEQNTISIGAQVAKIVIEQVKPLLDRENIMYDGVGGVKLSVTDDDVQAIFNGLTKTQLDDGMYALTSVLKTAIDGSYAQLVNLASRS